MYNPPWKDYEAGIRSDNIDEALRSADAFTASREKELGVSAIARDFERSRKEEAKRDKKHYLRSKQADIDNQDPAKKILNQIKNGGELDYSICPTRGYILISLEYNERIEPTGLVLAESEDEPNKGVVVSVGGETYEGKYRIDPPAVVGELVLFKKFAGMNIKHLGTKCRLMLFSDILGVLKEIK